MEDIKKIVLPITEIIVIIVIIFLLLLTDSINTTAIEKVEKLEEQVKAQEKMINFLINADQNNCNPDTIIININATNKIR